MPEALSELKLKRLVNSALRKNSNSINLMKRLGFQIETNLHSADEGVVGGLGQPKHGQKVEGNRETGKQGNR